MNPTTEAIRPLPRQTRPRPGETVESFVHRLARTNHLRPSHLRRLLLNNRNRPYGGSINLTRLATLTGRNAATLGRAFQATEPSHPGPTPVEKPAGRRLRRQSDKPELFAEIRDAAREHDLSIRALADRFRVHRRTIRQALTASSPPAPKKPVRRSYALHGLHRHIDAMLHTDPGIPAGHIWERLIDEYDATVSYSTLRGYVARQRRVAQTLIRT